MIPQYSSLISSLAQRDFADGMNFKLECLLSVMHRSPGVPYIAFYPGSLNGPLSITLPSSVASVPVFSSQLSDHMTLWGRAQNVFYSFMAPIGRSVLM